MSGIQWAARLMPPFLVGVVAYVTYAVVVTLVVNFLFYPNGDIEARVGAGVVILLIFLILLVLMTVSFFRSIYHGIFDAGFIGPTSHDPEGKIPSGQGEWQRKPGAKFSRFVSPGQSLESFYEKDFFVCDENGKPFWCDKCEIWKPDRAHHLKSVGHCVARLDHYCPWVGGIVGKRNFKFFILFDMYAALFSLYALIISGIFLGRGNINLGSRIINLGVTIALGIFFLLLAGGTGTSAMLCAGMNLTTLENVHQKDAVWRIAIRLSPDYKDEGSIQIVTAPQDPRYRYAVIQTPPGANPFDMGVLKNFKQVMGRRWWDWILPIRSSPICEPTWPRPDDRAEPSLCVEYLRQQLERGGDDRVDPYVRARYERSRRRQGRFPHVLAAAGAPLKTCTVAFKKK